MTYKDALEENGRIKVTNHQLNKTLGSNLLKPSQRKVPEDSNPEMPKVKLKQKIRNESKFDVNDFILAPTIPQSTITR